MACLLLAGSRHSAGTGTGSAPACPSSWQRPRPARLCVTTPQSPPWTRPASYRAQTLPRPTSPGNRTLQTFHQGSCLLSCMPLQKFTLELCHMQDILDTLRCTSPGSCAPSFSVKCLCSTPPALPEVSFGSCDQIDCDITPVAVARGLSAAQSTCARRHSRLDRSCALCR